MTLEEYTQYRTGSIKVSSIIRNMLLKPFVSSSFRSFWKYWNPSWGYFLLFYCYKPVRAVFPDWVSLTITFLVSGLVHDMIYVVPMVMNNGEFVFPFITLWFLIIAFGILLTELLHIDFRKIKTTFRPILHLGYLVGTFLLTRLIDLSLG
jgi:hypothetical protein